MKHASFLELERAGFIKIMGTQKCQAIELEGN
jgi:hypothetical protein